MTIDELSNRLSTYPRDAHVTGFVEPETGRVGLLVVWENMDRVRTVFVETPLKGGMHPAPPKKAKRAMNG